MFLSLLFSSPALALAWAVAIILSLTVHEFCHALVGKLRGDRTAEREGRLTLNPIAHMDPIGMVPLLLFGFGWAKPVPFNPYNLKNPKWDAVLIAIAGPVSNLVLAILAALVFRFFVGSGFITDINLLVVFLFFLILLNLFLFFFNLIPVHPLDGSKLFFALFDGPKYAVAREALLRYGPQVLFGLVLLSLFTSFNVFFFVSAPAYAVCSLLLGDSCIAFTSLF